jgi:ribonuclease-3
MKELEALSKKLGYQFKDLAYLDCALTHRSANQNHYERMEFLGDAILNFVISSALFDQFPDATEGELSRLRAHLVKGDSLSELAIEANLSDYLRLGSGELKSGGFRRKSILADVIESIIGAIYLDGGIQPAREFILQLFSNKLASVDASKNLKDPKTQLQEYMQARGLPLPDYEIVTTSGKAHKQTFTVACKIDLLSDPLIAKGSSRRKAEQAAAQQALDQLET